MHHRGAAASLCDPFLGMSVSRMQERYLKPGDIPTPLPIFPLRGVILFPRALLPLNVFEPRYLEMVDEALSGDRVIGMIQPASDEGYDDGHVESPEGRDVALSRVGCAGRITAYQETDDGHVLITLTGISRFLLLDELVTLSPFRVANVDFSKFGADLIQGEGEEDVDRDRLLSVLKVYLEANELKADWQNVLSSSSEFLVNTLSMISPYGAEEKQALLEAQDLKTRAEVLVALAEMELAARDDGSGSAVQ